MEDPSVTTCGRCPLPPAVLPRSAHIHPIGSYSAAGTNEVEPSLCSGVSRQFDSIVLRDANAGSLARDAGQNSILTLLRDLGLEVFDNQITAGKHTIDFFGP